MKKAISFFFFYLFTVFGNCQTLTFAIFGDCHLQDTITPGEKILSKIVENINRHPAIEFVVCLGDIVGYPSSINPESYYKTLEKYLKITGNIRVPMYTIPGNHDLEGGMKFKEVFQKIFGDLFFSVEKNGFVLIFLNSEDLSEQRIEWLKTELKKQGTKLVFMHKPILPAFNLPGHTIDLRTTAQLKHLFERNDVAGVFSGHDHLLYIRNSEKFTQVISGGAGGKLAPAPKDGKSAYHYCIITVDEKNKVLVKPVMIETN